LQRAQDRSVEWVLDLPAKVLTEHDPVLAAHLAAAESEAAYENLCLLYVALTQTAMYLVTELPAAKSSRIRICCVIPWEIRGVREISGGLRT